MERLIDMTTPKHVVRILKAAAVLLDTEDVKISSAVQAVTTQLLTDMWTVNFPTFRRPCDIDGFWNAVKAQTLRSIDVSDLIISTGFDSGERYGQTVELELVTKSSEMVCNIEITAKI